MSEMTPKDMTALAQTIAKQVLEALQTAKGTDKQAASSRPCVLVIADRAASLCARVQELVAEDADVLFRGECTAGRTPVRHILPVLSCSDMADLAAGRAATPDMGDVLQLLLKGTEVETIEFGYKAYEQTAPDALYNLYASYEKQLAVFGLIEFRFKRPDTIRFREKLVTEKTVTSAQEAGASTLLVPLGANITPLATEVAKRLDLTILKRL